MHISSVFSELLKAFPRYKFERLQEKVGYIKKSRSFSDWHHLVAMIYAQVTSQGSLRQLVGSFNEQYAQHYHLGVSPLKLSTLSYANHTRDNRLFCAVLSELIQAAGAHNTCNEVVRLIDSSPIALRSDIYGDFAKSNGRCKGIKLHMEYDLHGGYPTCFDITPANVNDIDVAQYLTILPGATYVFDRGYMKFDWWQKLAEQNCRFVTRMQKIVRYEVVKENPCSKNAENILRDVIIKLTGKKSSSGFHQPLRLLSVQLENNDKTIEIASNDLISDAAVLADLYKRRWQIELLFKWIKQKLKIKKFMGESENAVKIQIITALITFLLITLYKQKHAHVASLSQLLLIIRVDPFRKINHRQAYDKQRQYKINNANQLSFLC